MAGKRVLVLALTRCDPFLIHLGFFFQQSHRGFVRVFHAAFAIGQPFAQFAERDMGRDNLHGSLEQRLTKVIIARSGHSTTFRDFGGMIMAIGGTNHAG